MTAYPVDAVIPEIIDSLQEHSGLVLLAPPGAGKTTRLPLALLDVPFLQSTRILILEPRRLAAVNAARWMASLLGEEPGQTIGYTIRFDRKVSRATRIEVVTEGILSRRLQHDPELAGVGLVILDEFHERSLHADLALALCRDVQTGLRPDLKLMVMSATLDGAPIAKLLGDVPVVACEGRSFPVQVTYSDHPASSNFVPDVTREVLRSLGEDEGDILVFLPGAREIRQCHRLLEESPTSSGASIFPLYGDLSFADQERAIKPMPPQQRKVVLATNIAETSLTIEGIKVVIDSGWYRRLRFDAPAGLNRLVLERISVASADQRTGRAGRLGPGRCHRMWTEYQHRSLLAFHPPEIATSDLSSLVLELALWGISDPTSLSWLTPPPASSYAEARKLLVRLKALDAEGRITPLGRRMAEMPLHPRIAALVAAAEARGEGRAGADVAALLSERDILRVGERGRIVASSSDLADRLEVLRQWRRTGKSHENFADTQALRVVARVAAELERVVRTGKLEEVPDVDTIGELLAVAYPDRIAKQREPGSRRYLLANGRGCVLSERSAVFDKPWIVAVEVEGGDGGEGVIRLASTISIDTIRRRFGEDITRTRVVRWDKREGRIECNEEERFESLVLSSTHMTPTPEEALGALLDGMVSGPGIAALNWDATALRFVARIRFLARVFPGEWPDVSEQYLSEHVTEWLGAYLDGVKSLEDLRRVPLIPPLQSLLSWEQRRKLDEFAPTHMEVPTGSRIPLEYQSGEPVLSVKLQELFGLAETPRIAAGRVPVLLHLLSPAGRPIQVTKDLKNFWDNIYSDVKRELKGRYPKHPWPDDPWSATPTRHAKRKGQGS